MPAGTRSPAVLGMAVVNGFLPMMMLNQTDTPVDDLKLSIQEDLLAPSGGYHTSHYAWGCRARPLSAGTGQVGPISLR